MVSWDEVERLRLEADTIMTRYSDVEQLLEQAHNEDGEHWETGDLSVTLETPTGESITLTLDFEADSATNAQSRYDRANELEAKLERRAQVDEQVASLPATPVAYLICYHLDYVGGDYPKSIARYLDAEREEVDALCQEMEQTGVLERVESGTVKQRNVKAKKSEEVRQHHTYYRLSREGDHLLRFLSEPDGQVNVVRHLPDSQQILTRLSQTGRDSPRATATELELEFAYARHLYRALQRVGLVVECSDDAVRGSATKDGGRNETFYAATERAERVLQALD